MTQYYKPTLQEFTWTMHTTSNCEVCEYFNQTKKGGYNKTSAPGRPCDVSVDSAVRKIMRIAPESLYPDVRSSLVFPSTSGISHDDILCCICKQTVDSPVYFTECKSLACGPCSCEVFKQSDCLRCPCCDSDHIRDLAQIKEPPQLVLKVLANLEITCSICTKTTTSGTNNDH